MQECATSGDERKKTEEVVKVRKRGRPRKLIKSPEEKKKLGRPKDVTKYDITCDICGKFFKHRCNFIIHERSHYGIREFECDFCHKRFAQRGQLTLHRRIHTGEKPYKCPHCTESFRVQALLDGHIFKHTGQGTKCPQCQSVFPTAAQAKQHSRDVHATEKSYMCQICGQNYKMQRSLKIHLESHDKRICAVCGKVFNTVHALKTHRRIHELNYKCNYCSRSFKSDKELQAHSKLRGRVYQCDVCCYSFNKAEFLSNHNQRNHWKEMGLKQLPRKNAKPEDRKAHETARNSTSAESSLQTIELVENTPKQSELLPVTEWRTQFELISPKLEKSNNQDQSDNDLDFSIMDESEGNQHDDETYEQDLFEEIDCKSNVVVKVEPVIPSFQPVEFIKVEIYQENAIPTLREDSTKTLLVELNVEKEESLSTSEDDEVPLATLFAHPGRLPKSGINEQMTNPGEFSSEDNTLTIEAEANPMQKRKHKNDGPRKSVNRSREITCQLCDEVFSGRIALRKHRKSSHPDSNSRTGPVICEICGKSYKTFYSLTVHRGQHEKYQRFKCDECPKTFVYNSHLTNHKRIQHRQERHVCPLCGKQYKYTVDLRHHLLRHEDERPFKCDECPATFTHYTALHAHKPIHRQQVFPCTICDKKFRFASSLRAHKRLHNRANYIRCQLCEREFCEKALLKKHMAIHTVDREVMCIVCDKVYYKKSELMIHQAKLHPNHPLIGVTIKIHSCKVCGLEFTKASHLRTHSFIHGTDYCFKCDMCEDQKFKQKAGLRNHWIRFHNINPPKANGKSR